MPPITSGFGLIPKRKLGEEPDQIQYTIKHIQQLFAPSLNDRTLWANDANPVLTIEQDGTGPNLLLKHATVPELRFEEEDQTDPAGQYRFRVNGDILYLERATSASWGGSSPVLTIDYNFGRLELMASGNTIGDIRGNSSTSTTIYRANNTGTLWLVGGTLSTNSAVIQLLGGTATLNPGSFILGTTDATDNRVNRLTITGDVTTALATWSNTEHTSLRAREIEIGSSESKTISVGVISVTRSLVLVDTEGGAATDNLDTINGGVSGQFLILKAANTARDIVLKHATGNIYLRAGADITLDNTEKAVLLFYDGTNWMDL